MSRAFGTVADMRRYRRKLRKAMPWRDFRFGLYAFGKRVRPYPPEKFGETMALSRVDADLTLAVAAKVLGVHVNTLRRWESSEAQPRLCDQETAIKAMRQVLLQRWAEKALSGATPDCSERAPMPNAVDQV